MESPLLRQLQSALNRLYDGNITANEAYKDYESGVRHEDTYTCPLCKGMTPSKEWDEVHKCCQDCYYDYQQEINSKHQEQ